MKIFPYLTVTFVYNKSDQFQDDDKCPSQGALMKDTHSDS